MRLHDRQPAKPRSAENAPDKPQRGHRRPEATHGKLSWLGPEGWCFTTPMSLCSLPWGSVPQSCQEQSSDRAWEPCAHPGSWQTPKGGESTPEHSLPLQTPRAEDTPSMARSSGKKGRTETGPTAPTEGLVGVCSLHSHWGEKGSRGLRRGVQKMLLCLALSCCHKQLTCRNPTGAAPTAMA